jgi:branched-chain amino acid transport system ATP-binding protein
MLSIENLDTRIAGIDILQDVSLTVDGGRMVGLIGRNGAGKTTLMRSVMGLLPAASGRIAIGGETMSGREAHFRARAGVGYMPEDRRLVPSLTVEENILSGAWACRIERLTPRLAWVYDVIPEIAPMAQRRALQLSGGQQKLVALGRALMVGHRLLLLDEPFEGVAPVLARRLASVLHTLKAEGLTVLLSESDYTHSADLLDAAYRIERGRVEPWRTQEAWSA